MPKFSKRIVRPGTYTVRRKDGTIARVYVGKNRIQKWIDNFKRMKEAGLQVPAPWRHEEKAFPVRLDADPTDTNAYNNSGFWDNLYVGKDGALWGDVDVPRREDAERVGTTVQDVSLLAKPEWMDGRGNKYEDALTHIALVTHPVDKDSKGFARVEKPVANTGKEGEGEQDSQQNAPETVALSLNDLLFANDPDDPGAQNNTTEPAINAGTASVDDAVRLLSEIASISLPEDTSGENFVERLVTALSAIRGRENKEGDGDDGTVREPPAGSKKQPGPVAMSKEHELTLSILNDLDVKNPDTNKPFTAEELEAKQSPPQETLKLSAEDQAAVNWARNERKGTYKSRIEACVAQGRVDPKTAEDFWKSLDKDEELRFSFNAEGKPVRNQYDFVLEAWEKTPRNASLTGHSPTSARASKSNVFGEHAFSLGSGVQEEPNETEHSPDEPMSEEDVDNILNLQFQASGKRANQIEGGLQRQQQ